MRTRGCTATATVITLSAVLLTWPALWNGYPLVFSDTGTYLSQAIEHYAGWDRPVFYSLFMLPLHMTLTTWPVVVAQALMVALVLHIARRTLLPETSLWLLLPLCGTMALASSLPWFVSQIMPDVFTGTLVLVLVVLIFGSERLSRLETFGLVGLATFLIAAHQSHVLLMLVLLVTLLPFRCRVVPAVPLLLAVAALVSVNLIAFGRASMSPFGNVFLLTRIIYDGPGADILRRDCPAAGWRLCAFANRLPPNADDFLWSKDGPVIQAGGAKLVSREADAIITAALHDEPVRELLALAGNTMQQVAAFATGDGLQPWPATVTPVIVRDFPASEANAYADARQTNGALAVPDWLRRLHQVAALSGVVGCLALLHPRFHRNHRLLKVLAATTLLALLVNAAITGGLSGPHDRYQSRIMWLPPLVATLGLAATRARV